MLYRKQRAEIGFATVQRRQFWPEWQEAWKLAQEDWGLSIAGSFGRGRYPIAKNACWAIGYFSSSHFHAATHAMGKVQKIGKWVHELNDKQMERRQNTCQILLARQKRKWFLHRIMTGDEEWRWRSIFRILNARNLGLIPPNHQYLPQDQIASDGRRCVWWDQEGVIYYELLKSDETVNAHRYHQQLIKLYHALREKRPHYRKRHDKLIFLHYNAPSHVNNVQNYFWEDTQHWEVLPHPAYSPDLALTITCFHRWATRSLSGTLILTKTSENGLMSGLPRKIRNFFGVVYTNCPKDGKNV